MLAWIDRAAIVLFDATVSTALYLTFVVLITLFCRQPARRILICRVAMLASLAILPVVALAPLPRLNLVEVVFNARGMPSGWELRSPLDHRSGVDDASVASLTAVAPSIPFYWGRLNASAWFGRSLVVLALVGMAIGIGWLFLGIWGVRWLFRHSREPADSTARIYSDLTVAAGHAIPAELRVSGKLRQPSICGILRPVIFIPARYEDANGASTEAIRLSLLHELAHADRADAWFSAAASFAQGIWFFLPQIWWIRSQLMIDQEFLADRSAALAYGTSTKYASSLVSLAGGGSASSSGQFAIIRTKVLEARTSGTPSVLFQRVLMLLHCPFLVEPTVSRASTWLVSSSLISASLLSACLVIRWPTPIYESPSHANHHSAEHVFQVAQIIARPQVCSLSGRSLPFVLPLALPSSFEISVDVQAARSDLPRIRLVDLPLDVGEMPESAPDDESLPLAPESAIPTWHHVRLQHSPDATRLTVDGRERIISPGMKLASQWLTIEPASEHSATLRDLMVRW